GACRFAVPRIGPARSGCRCPDRRRGRRMGWRFRRAWLCHAPCQCPFAGRRGFCRAPFARGDRGPDLVCGGRASRPRRAVVRQTPRLIVHGGRLKMFRIAAAAFALALSLTPAAAADRLTVLLDWFVNPDHAPLVVAKQGGFFEKHGLDVELVEPADPNAPPKL